MNKTKMVLCVLLISFHFIFMNASNPWEKTPVERGSLSIEGYSKILQLNSQQHDSILVLATKFAQKCDSINMLESLTIGERVNLKKDEHGLLKSSIDALLTESQKKQLKSKQDELKALIDSKKKNDNWNH